jgi:HSP20 family protein
MEKRTMPITRYTRRSPFLSPWRGLEDMSDHLNLFFGGAANGPAGPRAGWSPSVNVEESKDELILSAELPGMTIDDVEIEVENNVLSLRGEKKGEQEEQVDRRFHLGERRYGAFERRFTLPRTVKAMEISAHFKDGILYVQMPKAPEAKSRTEDIR